MSANQTARAAGRTLPFPTAGVAFPAPYTNVNDTYYDSGGIRRDWLGAVTLAVPLATWLDAEATYYHHYDKGSGGIYTPAVFSPATAVSAAFPLSVRTTEYGINRDGGLLRTTARMGAHTLSLGYWHEDNDASTDRNYYAVAQDNRPDVTAFLHNPFRSDFLTDLTTVTNQYFVSDTWKLADALTVAGGFKGARVSNGIVTTFGTPFINGRIAAKDWFQPQIGATFRAGGQEFFANYAENMRAFISSFRGPFGTTQAGFEAIRGTLRPETSRTIEAGWRFDLAGLRGVVAIYDVKFRNRLLAAFSGANILGNPSVLQNVGSVTSRGVEVGATYRVSRPLSLIASYSYNDSTYDDNRQRRRAGRDAGRTHRRHASAPRQGGGQLRRRQSVRQSGGRLYLAPERHLHGRCDGSGLHADRCGTRLSLPGEQRLCGA
ncbi:TonB-dependent receptor [Sphingomonas sp. LR60]